MALSAYGMTRTRGRTRELIALQIVAAGGLTISGIDALVEGSTGRAFFFFLFIFQAALFISYGRILDMFIKSTSLQIVLLSPLLATTDRVIGRLRHALLITGPLPAAFLFILSLALGNESSPSYNVELWNACIAVAFPLLSLVILAFGTPITLRSSRLMLQAIDSSHNAQSLSPDMVDVRNRIVVFRLWAGFILPFSLALCIILCFGIAYLFRWPVLYYFAAAAMLSGNLGPLVLTYVLSPHPGGSASGGKPSSPEHRHRGDAAAAAADDDDDYPAHKWGVRRHFSLESTYKTKTSHGGNNTVVSEAAALDESRL